MDINQLIILLAYFIIYSFFGWLLESLYKTYLQKKPVNSGFIFGPFCPIYGFGAIILYLTLDGFKSNFVIVFLIGLVIFSIWECLVGYLLEKIFNTKYWDYSNNMFNLNGKVCLLNSIFWGILAVIFIDIVHPFVENGLAKIEPELILKLDIIIIIIMLIDEAISVKTVIGMKYKLKRVEEINLKIKEKLEEIKQVGKGIEIKTDSLEKVVDELKLKRDRIIRRSYRYICRIKRAFPTIKSEQITKLLNQRKENLKK